MGRSNSQVYRMMGNAINKNIRATFLAKIPISFLALIHSILITRILGPEGIGIFQFLQTNVQFLVMLFGFNMTNGLIYFTSSGRIKESKTLSFVLILFLFAFLVLSSFLFILPFEHIWIKGLILPPEHQEVMFAVYFLFAFIYHFVQTLIHAHLKGRKAFITSNRLLIYANVLNVLVSITLFTLIKFEYTTLGLIQLFKVLTFLQLSLLITIIVFYVKEVPLKLDFIWKKSDLKTYFAYTSLGYGNMFSKFFNKRLDVYFVQFMKGSAQLGLYSIATSLTNFILDFVQPLNQVVLPYLTTMDESETKRVYPLFLRVFTLLVLLPVSILFVFSESIISLLYGEAFVPAAGPLKVMAVATIFAYARNYFSSYNNAKDRVRFNLMSNVLALILTVVLDLALIPYYGILGASFATLAAYSFSCILVAFTVKRHMNIAWMELLKPKRSDFATVVRIVKDKF